MGADGVAELSAEVTRVADRLRTLGTARLARPLHSGRAPGSVVGDPADPSARVGGPAGVAGGVRGPGGVAGGVGARAGVADVAHALAQALADLAADVEGRPRRPVPRIDDHAVGDQVAVTGHDLVALGDRLTPEQVDTAVGWLRDLRRVLP